jgi:hypothetical protein
MDLRSLILLCRVPKSHRQMKGDQWGCSLPITTAIEAKRSLGGFEIAKSKYISRVVARPITDFVRADPLRKCVDRPRCSREDYDFEPGRANGERASVLVYLKVANIMGFVKPS